MKKILMTLALLICCALVFTACIEDDTSVLEEKTITVKNAEDLASLRDYVGSRYSKYIFTFALQGEAIDLSSIPFWEPIGTEAEPFMGTVKGNGAVIKNLTISGIDSDGKFTKTAKKANGLFGYTRNATIENLTITDARLSYYSYGSANYAGILAGYNSGNSRFENITVSGEIRLSNQYYERITYDERGEEQNRITYCDSNQYMGGLLGFSSGLSAFSGVTTEVIITNDNYHAILKDGEYEVNNYDWAQFLPKQVFAGGFAGFVRNGALTDISAKAEIQTQSLSAYAGGLTAALFESTAEDITVTDSVFRINATTKETVGGIVALIDSSELKNTKGQGLTLHINPHETSMQSASAGGVVGYAYDFAVIDGCEIDGLVINSTATKISFGGIIGATRNADVINCKVENARIKLGSANYENCGSVAGSVYGNSVLRNCAASVSNDTVLNTKPVAKDSPLTYVNEDGQLVAKIVNRKNSAEYMTVHIQKMDNSDTIFVTVYDENNKIVEEFTTRIIFDLIDSAADSDSAVFIGVVFQDGIGLQDSAGVKEYAGRNWENYVYLSGIPTIDL